MKCGSTIYTTMAIATVIVWGLTFVSTKLLITSGLSPVEIFIIRFSIAYICTLIFSHDRLWSSNLQDELLMFAAGLTGGSLYFIAENTALSITFASNVSLIICCAPIFTLFLGRAVFRYRIKGTVWIGSLIALSGVAMVVLNGSEQYGLNPIGDLFTVLAALSWAAYCLLLKKLNCRYSNIFITRKVFVYGVITSLLFYIIFPSTHHIILTETTLIIANLLFLGVGASFLCYLMWNNAVFHLGAERTSNYIYLVPLVTVIASTLILDEPFTFIMALGTALIIGGVFLSTK